MRSCFSACFFSNFLLLPVGWTIGIRPESGWEPKRPPKQNKDPPPPHMEMSGLGPAYDEYKIVSYGCES